MKKLVTTVALLFSLGSPLLAQKVNQELKVENLKPVAELVEIAIARSPNISALNYSQEQISEETTIAKQKWMQYLSLAAGVNYGNGIISDQFMNDQSGQSLTYLTRQNVTYNVGLNFRIPLTGITSRKHEIKIKNLEVKKMEQMKHSESDLIEREIIKLYSNLKQFLIAVEIQAEVVHSKEMALSVAEGYFKSGKLPVEQYSSAVETSYAAKLEFEKVKNEAWLAYNSLKSLVGQEILKP